MKNDLSNQLNESEFSKINPLKMSFSTSVLTQISGVYRGSISASHGSLTFSLPWIAKPNSDLSSQAYSVEIDLDGEIPCNANFSIIDDEDNRIAEHRLPSILGEKLSITPWTEAVMSALPIPAARPYLI